MSKKITWDEQLTTNSDNQVPLPKNWVQTLNTPMKSALKTTPKNWSSVDSMTTPAAIPTTSFVTPSNLPAAPKNPTPKASTNLDPLYNPVYAQKPTFNKPKAPSTIVVPQSAFGQNQNIPLSMAPPQTPKTVPLPQTMAVPESETPVSLSGENPIPIYQGINVVKTTTSTPQSNKTSMSPAPPIPLPTTAKTPSTAPSPIPLPAPLPLKTQAKTPTPAPLAIPLPAPKSPFPTMPMPNPSVFLTQTPPIPLNFVLQEPPKSPFSTPAIPLPAPQTLPAPQKSPFPAPAIPLPAPQTPAKAPTQVVTLVPQTTAKTPIQVVTFVPQTTSKTPTPAPAIPLPAPQKSPFPAPQTPAKATTQVVTLVPQTTAKTPTPAPAIPLPAPQTPAKNPTQVVTLVPQTTTKTPTPAPSTFADLKEFAEFKAIVTNNMDVRNEKLYGYQLAYRKEIQSLGNVGIDLLNQKSNEILTQLYDNYLLLPTETPNPEIPNEPSQSVESEELQNIMQDIIDEPSNEPIGESNESLMDEKEFENVVTHAMNVKNENLYGYQLAYRKEIQSLGNVGIDLLNQKSKEILTRLYTNYSCKKESNPSVCYMESQPTQAPFPVFNCSSNPNVINGTFVSILGSNEIEKRMISKMILAFF